MRDPKYIEPNRDNIEDMRDDIDASNMPDEDKAFLHELLNDIEEGHPELWTDTTTDDDPDIDYTS